MAVAHSFWGLKTSLVFSVLFVASCSHDAVSNTSSTQAPPKAPIELAKPAAVPASGSFTLAPGDTATIVDGTTLQYVRLVKDSRCPPKAQCVWAGEVEIELSLDTGSEKQSFNLSDRNNTATVLGMQVEMVSIDRAHIAVLKVTKV